MNLPYKLYFIIPDWTSAGRCMNLDLEKREQMTGTKRKTNWFDIQMWRPKERKVENEMWRKVVVAFV